MGTWGGKSRNLGNFWVGKMENERNCWEFRNFVILAWRKNGNLRNFGNFVKG